MKVLEFPLTKITISFILGIIIAYKIDILNPEVVFLLLMLSVLVLSIAFFSSKKTFFGIFVIVVSFFIGISSLLIHSDSFQKNNYIHFSDVFEKPQYIKATLLEKMKTTPLNERYVAVISKIGKENYTGKIILNIHKDSLEHKFEVGTNLIFYGSLLKNNNANNPNSFDYGKYLKNKQIYAQAYVSAVEIAVEPLIQKDIWYYSSKLRNTILENLTKGGFNKTEMHVAMALILGQQQDISPEIIQDYQYAGAVHILSVSGLHVGFILLAISFLLKPIPNNKRGSRIKLIIILLSLISFGVLTGLSPSVTRSVVMFSFVAVGNYLRRGVNIYHTLLVSMFIILLVQPYFLFDIGFQLSYIAVFFIIWLQPIFSSLWVPKNIVLGYFWDIITVSFAAQIGALPLSLYYFHQFPGLFFITNLIIIPILSIIMVIGVLVVVLAAIDYAPYFLIKSLEYSILFMNKIISAIASLEDFIVRDISFDGYLLASFYIFIISIFIWLYKPDFKKLVFVLISIILIQISFIKIKTTISGQQDFIVFNTKNHTLIAERTGFNVIVYSDEETLKNTRDNRVLNTYLVENFSKITKKQILKNTLFFNNKKILIIDSSSVYLKELNPDILLLTNSPKINLERLLQTLKPKLVIADASNYVTIQNYWQKTCLKANIPFHSTNKNGFFRIN